MSQESIDEFAEFLGGDSDDETILSNFLAERIEEVKAIDGNCILYVDFDEIFKDAGEYVESSISYDPEFYGEFMYILKGLHESGHRIRVLYTSGS